MLTAYAGGWTLHFVEDNLHKTLCLVTRGCFNVLYAIFQNIQR